MMMNIQRHGAVAVAALMLAGAMAWVPSPLNAQMNFGSNRTASHCPPGLAKKNPPCVPPGQAAKGAVQVGEVLRLGNIHIITRPGRYGLGDPPPGDRYAIVNGRLIRVDENSGKVRSILRVVDAILD